MLPGFFIFKQQANEFQLLAVHANGRNGTVDAIKAYPCTAGQLMVFFSRKGPAAVVDSPGNTPTSDINFFMRPAMR